ncbi:MAG: UDP-glucose 4-epimerase GalE, partial [Lysobacterales bacterium]
MAKNIKTKQKALVTGGAGYIGSHTCLELLEGGYDVVAVDNLSNSSKESLNRVQTITGKTLTFIQCDLLDKVQLGQIFADHQPDTVIHFAGLKAVGESVVNPLDYYRNNVLGTATLLEVMVDNGIKNIVFSSSCTVYGAPKTLPISEGSPLGAVNPYGKTKLIIERMLKDLQISDPSWNISILRYFNPVGAHQSGEIGEDPRGTPTNLMPYMTQVAVGERKELSVFGGDYPTRDGTCVRDYIHVVDVAKGHLKALEKLSENPGVIVHNLGTGQGHTVLEIIHSFEASTGQNVPYSIVNRRPGDAVSVYANPELAELDLKWKPGLGLNRMCE